jgi:hypothetical protein
MVEDDSPTGFRNIEHAYTLFADTYKRKDSTKRGRFNIGEKLVFALCNFCMVETTKGTVVFDDKGRHRKYNKRALGSKITIQLNMNQEEYDELLSEIELYLPPKNIDFYVNDEPYNYHEPFKIFNTTLTTEVDDDGILKRRQRKTDVYVHDIYMFKNYLYEMGIPVCEIDCDYSIDVQQRIPLSTDRETVSEAFLKDLYAEVLNHVYEDIDEDMSSNTWIREGMSDDRINKDAVKNIVEKRYGKDVVFASPTDPISIDDAKRQNIKRFDLINTSHNVFGHNVVAGETVTDLTVKQKRFKNLAIKIAKEIGVDLTIRFARFKGVPGQYDNQVLTVNLQTIENGFFDDLEEQIKFLLHEIPHEKGHHTEKEYHQTITKLGARLTMLALNSPEWFDDDYYNER